MMIDHSKPLTHVYVRECMGKLIDLSLQSTYTRREMFKLAVRPRVRPVTEELNSLFSESFIVILVNVCSVKIIMPVSPNNLAKHRLATSVCGVSPLMLSSQKKNFCVNTSWETRRYHVRKERSPRVQSYYYFIRLHSNWSARKHAVSFMVAFNPGCCSSATIG